MGQELNKFYSKETGTLEKMKKLQHPHLIEAISVYERGTARCAIFPWAPGGNLRQLWSRDTGGVTWQQRHQWAWTQIRGLADGLKRLHANKTRHGDVKPENILIFDGADKSGLGVLVIADVGIAKFHAEETRERQARGYATTSKHGTLRYEPPDIELRKGALILHKYDCWSLGCVLLEFIIWLLCGNEGQKRFNRERLSAGSRLDRYWDQDSNREPIVHPVVQRWIEEELAKPLETAPALRELIGLVARYLLVADLDSRKHMWEFCERLERIKNQCSADPPYPRATSGPILTESRKSEDGQPNDFDVRISQRVGPTARLEFNV